MCQTQPRAVNVIAPPLANRGVAADGSCENRAVSRTGVLVPGSSPVAQADLACLGLIHRRRFDLTPRPRCTKVKSVLEMMTSAA